MAYERFYEALEGYERGENLEWNARKLSNALFEHIPKYSDWLPATELDTLLARGIPRSEIEETGPILFDEFEEAYVYEGYVRVANPEVQAEFVGEKEVYVGMPNPFPSADMLDRLTQLELPDTSYRPDEDEQLHDELCTAIYVRGTALLAMWLISGYGDDIQPTHGELENLLARFDRIDNSPEEVAHIRCLSKRVAAELAFQNGDYATALDEIADALYCLYDWSHSLYSPSLFAPWLSGVKVRARVYLDNIEDMPGRNVDWSRVAKACEAIGKSFYNKFVEGDEYTVWMQRTGWAQAQLTPDQLRIYLRDREDEGSVQRLQAYFLPDDLWKKLPKRAQEALISADRALVSATHGRRSGIVNEIRIATEEVLYCYLWLPLSETQPLPHPGLKMILDKPKQERHSPNIGDYVQLLWHSRIKDYFQNLGMSDDDVRFLTEEDLTTKHLQSLQRTRNAAEHEPGGTIDLERIRQLYAESLGIGCRGVLPEFVRLLARIGGARPDAPAGLPPRQSP